MDSINNNLFMKVFSRPRWEGIVFTDLDFSDHRISVFNAEPILNLQEYIEYIWFMKWDFNEQDGAGCIRIPNPCTKLVALQQKDKTFPPLVYGTNAEAEFFTFRGAGATVGFDFKPGGLYPFLGKSLNDWPAEGILAQQFFPELPTPPQEIWTPYNLSKWITEIQNVLSSKLKLSSENNYTQLLPLVNKAIQGTINNPEEMAQISGTSLRSLQRIFQNEVGLSPRDLLRIARFNEALRKISSNDFQSFADIALESGFFDQPHMINEFQKLASTSPSKFRRYL